MDETTCLIERSKVREILMASDRMDSEATSELLAEVDTLPILTLGDAEVVVERLRQVVDRLKLEAQGHAQEARAANHTIAQAYQAVTGAKGEPGNWNGAVPVATELDRLRAGYRAIMAATTAGRVCDDVAWFDGITTLYDFCDAMLLGLRPSARSVGETAPEKE